MHNRSSATLRAWLFWGSLLFGASCSGQHTAAHPIKKNKEIRVVKSSDLIPFIYPIFFFSGFVYYLTYFITYYLSVYVVRCFFFLRETPYAFLEQKKKSPSVESDFRTPPILTKILAKRFLAYLFLSFVTLPITLFLMEILFFCFFLPKWEKGTKVTETAFWNIYLLFQIVFLGLLSEHTFSGEKITFEVTKKVSDNSSTLFHPFEGEPFFHFIRLIASTAFLVSYMLVVHKV